MVSQKFTKANGKSTNLVVQSILVKSRRWEVIAFGNIPSNKEFHPAASVSQHLRHVVVCEQVKMDIWVNIFTVYTSRQEQDGNLHLVHHIIDPDSPLQKSPYPLNNF